MKSKTIIIIVAIIAVFFIFASAYTIDETEQVVITQFGRVVGSPKTSPGLYFKLPFIQNTNYFPKNLLEWDGPIKITHNQTVISLVMIIPDLSS